MDKLPLELFLRVISSLDKEDQFSCMYVCKAWCSNLQKSSLLYGSVRVNDSLKFQMCSTFFQKHPEFRTQVKDLILIETSISDHNLLQLPALFPNVEHFTHEESANPIRTWNQREASKAFSKWSPAIKTITETGSPIAAPSVLATQKCPHLVSMKLGFVGYEDESKKKKILTVLGKAPNLMYLQLQWLNMTFKDAEKMFKCAPNLKAVGFYQVGFEPRGKLSPSSIEPSEEMETVCMDKCYFARVSPWVSYFTRKCPNMKNFLLSFSEEDESYGLGREAEGALVDLVKKCDNLEFYSVRACPLSTGVLAAIESNKKLNLKHISFGSANWEVVVQSLQQLCKSKQKNNIESLIVSGTSYSTLESEFRPKKQFFKALAGLSNLKHLRINESKEEVERQDWNIVPLDTFLKLLDLESLTMDFATFEVIEENDEPYKTNLKKLVMEESYAGARRFEKPKSKNGLRDSELYNKEKIYQDKSMEVLSKKLPNTEIVERELDEEDHDDEYAHLFQVN